MSTLTYRVGLSGYSGKGSPLTNAEVDANFYNINNDKLESSEAVSTNTANKVVKRDSSGNFSAGTITATLSGAATTATNLAGGGAGTVPYQSAAGTTVQLASGTSGQLFKSNGASAPAWVDPSTIDAGSVDGKSFGTFTAAGGILYATSTTAANSIGAGTSGQYLISGGAGAPTWGSAGDVYLNTSQTLTNKTIALGSNTISGTLSQFNTAVTDADLVSTSGTETLSNKTLNAPILTGVKETKVAMAASDINLASGNYFTKTISATTTFTVSTVPDAGTVACFILDLTNGASAIINWSTSFGGSNLIKWVSGSAPSLTASGRDVLGFFTHDGGTTWSGFLLGKDVK